MNKKVWYNANVVTLDPAIPRAEALISNDGMIEFAGSTASALERAPRDCERVDLEGKTVVPGFNDNHVHSVILGDQKTVPNLSGLDADQIVATLRERFSGAPKGRLILAYDWDYPACPDPHRRILDEAFPDNPVLLAQVGGHGMWLNTQALRKLGIGRQRPDPPEGVVLRDENRDPTGVVREMGNNRFFATHFFKMFFSPSLLRPRMTMALDVFRKYGITSVQENAWFVPVVFELVRRRRRGTLTARYSCWSYGTMPRSIPFMRLARYDDRWVRRGAWKYFLDGSFTTRTAWLSEPYADDPGNAGSGIDGAASLKILRVLASRRVQGAFHAIGDRAVGTFLDSVERLYAEHPEARELRFRLEHAQLIRPEDIPRLRALGVLVAAQPSALASPEKDIRLLGRARAESAYPHRSLLDEGVQLSFGSDIPGEPTCDPIRCIAMVANRNGPERITAEEALRCYTVGSAYAEFQEERKGTLAPGMLADFAVLSGDLTRIPPEAIGETVVEKTVVDGRIVYDRASEGGGIEPEKTEAPDAARRR